MKVRTLGSTVQLMDLRVHFLAYSKIGRKGGQVLLAHWPSSIAVYPTQKWDNVTVIGEATFGILCSHLEQRIQL